MNSTPWSNKHQPERRPGSTGRRFVFAKKHFAKRGKSGPHEDEDVLDGDSWYMLTPEFIDLVDEEHIGFEKQTLKL